MPLLPENTAAKLLPQGEPRDRQYAYVGAYIAHHSQILIALWDGLASDAEGGTAQIVRFKLLGVPERYAFADEVSSRLDPADSGPVYHIVTPRASNPSPPRQAFSLTKLFPQSHERDALAEALYGRIYARATGSCCTANAHYRCRKPKGWREHGQGSRRYTSFAPSMWPSAIWPNDSGGEAIPRRYSMRCGVASRLWTPNTANGYA